MVNIYKNLKNIDIKGTLNDPKLFASDKKEKNALWLLVKDIPDEHAQDLEEDQQHTINVNLIDYFLERLESDKLLTDVESFVLHSLLPVHFDTISDNGKTEAVVKLHELKKQEFQKAGKELPKELKPGEKAHQLQSGLEKYAENPTESNFFIGINNLSNEINKSLKAAKANLPPKWKNFGWLSFFKTEEEINAEIKVRTAPADLKKLDEIRENMANRQKVDKESQNPNTLRTIKELLKEYTTDDNSKTLEPLQQAINENKERQPSWKTFDHNQSALQTVGMMHHSKENKDNRTDDLNESSLTTPNPTHHQNDE